MSIWDVLSVVSVLLIAGSLSLNWLQQRRDSAQKRDEFVANLVFKYLDDTRAADALSQITCGITLRQEVDVMQKIDVMQKTATLLHHLDKIAHFYEVGLISTNDLRFVARDFTRVHNYLSVVNRELLEEYPHFHALANALKDGDVSLMHEQATLRDAGLDDLTVSVLAGALFMALADSIAVGLSPGAAYLVGVAVMYVFLTFRDSLRGMVYRSIHSYRSHS